MLIQQLLSHIQTFREGHLKFMRITLSQIYAKISINKVWSYILGSQKVIRFAGRERYNWRLNTRKVYSVGPKYVLLTVRLVTYPALLYLITCNGKTRKEGRRMFSTNLRIVDWQVDPGVSWS